METATVVVGGTSPAKAEESVVEIQVQDIAEEILKPVSNKTLAQEIKDKAQDISKKVLIQTLVSGAKRFAGGLARNFMNMKRDSLEKYVQWILANFLLKHDSGQSCDKGSGSLKNFLNTMPDYGKCYFGLSHLAEPDKPLWKGIIYSGGNGKTDHHATNFKITLAVKIDQIRGLEALQVQKNQCYGDFMKRGGFCDLELAPWKEHPLKVTGIELAFNCEGDCYAQQHATALLTNKEELLVGDVVYIKKMREEMVQTLLWGQRETEVATSLWGRELAGCASEEAKGTIWKNIFVCMKRKSERSPNASGPPENCQKVKRHCVEASDGTKMGCWSEDNLIFADDCVRKPWKFIARVLGGRNASSEPAAAPEKPMVRPIIYRKFDAIFSDIKIRTRVYIHRTRSLQEVVNEQPKEKKPGVAGKLERFVDKVTFAAKVLRHPREMLQPDRELIEKYEMNTKEKKDAATGEVIGYELVTCSKPVKNQDTDKVDPPHEKCFKIDVADLQVLATASDYVRIEEKAAWQNPPSGWKAVLLDWLMWMPGALLGATMGYENLGLVLAACEKIVHMMFVRDVVQISAGGKFCKDKWHQPMLSLGNASGAEEAYAVGVKCDYTNLADDLGSGINAAYDFEVVELFPVWNRERQRNDMEIGIRGGYNLQFCRVVTKIGPPEIKAGAQVGQLLCDLSAPLEERTHMVQPNLLPDAARFLVEHIGENDQPSKIVIHAGGDDPEGKAAAAAGDAGCSGAGCNDSATDEHAESIARQVAEKAGIMAERISVRLKNKETMKNKETGHYCSVQDMKYKKYGGTWSSSRPMFICNAPAGSELSLQGNVDPLTPSPFWELLLKMVFTAVFAGHGWLKGKWAVFFGGASPYYVFFTVVAGGLLGALLAEGIAIRAFALDGIMIRYLLKTHCQRIGQHVLWCVESALTFEFPRA